MKVFEKISHWKNFRKESVFQGKRLGFVPTMGALHEGHLSLIRQSQKENDFTLVSIFLNPTQFNDPNDLKNYPKTWEQDLSLLKEVKTDFLLHPEASEVYADSYRFRITENELSQKFCGAHRPGHFDGVLTVVLKLLQIAQSDRAYFGEKDYQQYLLIRDLAQSFFLPTEIRSCPIVRETDGLAMSSRNTLLSPEEREQAPLFYQTLKNSKNSDEAKTHLQSLGLRVDYVEDFENRRLAAVHLGSVRLIDNVEIR